MSKSAVVLDTPRTCDKCRFYYNVDGGSPVCVLSNRRRFNEGVPKWCELQKLPEMIKIPSNRADYATGCMQGFNDCLEMIIGTPETMSK